MKPGKPLPRRHSRSFGKNLQLTLIALPAIIFIFVFAYIPMYGLILPFKDFDISKGFFGSEWVGLKNFEFLFTSNQIWEVTRNTLLYNLAFIVIGTVVAIFLAILLYELKPRAVKVYQTSMFFPYFISWVVASYILSGFLDSNYGIVNGFLNAIGVDSQLWYSKAEAWPVILIIANLWKSVGVNTIIFYGVLIGVDPQYYETFMLDSTSRFKRAIHVSLPFLMPVIVLLTIMSIGKIFFADFGMFQNLPLQQAQLFSTTDVIDTFVYRAVRKLGNFSMASAAGFYQSICGFVLVMLTNFIVSKISPENRMF